MSLDGKKMDPVELVEQLDAIAGAHGFGRVDMVENRLVGIKSREVYEVRGLAVAHHGAPASWRTSRFTRELQHFKTAIDQRMTELIYDGLWFSPLADCLRAFIDESQKHVTGEVRLRYFKGSCSVVGRRSPNSLYVASWPPTARETPSATSRPWASSSLWGLPLEVWARRREGLL